MGGVDAVDVEARIGLGIAELLRLGQHVGELAALRRIVVRMKLQVPLRMP